VEQEGEVPLGLYKDDADDRSLLIQGTKDCPADEEQMREENIKSLS